MTTRWIWITTFVLAVCLIWVVTKDRWWFRTDNLGVFVDGKKITTLNTYQSSSGRVLIVTDGYALLSDTTRSSMGIPQGGVWFSTGAACIGLRTDALLIPIGKSHGIWKDVELRGAALKDGRIKAKLPAVVLSGRT